MRQVLATSALQLFCLKNPSSELLHVALGCLRYQNFDPYGILDVSSAASSSQIKKAFHKLSLKYHPDKNQEVRFDGSLSDSVPGRRQRAISTDHRGL